MNQPVHHQNTGHRQGQGFAGRDGDNASAAYRFASSGTGAGKHLLPDLLLALTRSFASLTMPRIWWYLLAPALASLLVWIGLALWVLDDLVAQFASLPPMTWLSGWGAVWLAHLLATLGGWAVMLTAAYLTAILLAAVFILPLLLEHLARHQYADLARRGNDNFVAATWNSLWALALFVLAWLLTLPLWLIPGVGLVLPLLLLAWLNRRTFAYDALATHAEPGEWQELKGLHAKPFFALGLLLAIFGHIPLLGLLAPTLAVLAYLHYSLEALRRLRGDAVLTINATRVDD